MRSLKRSEPLSSAHRREEGPQRGVECGGADRRPEGQPRRGKGHEHPPVGQHVQGKRPEGEAQRLAACIACHVVENGLWPGWANGGRGAVRAANGPMPPRSAMRRDDFGCAALRRRSRARGQIRPPSSGGVASHTTPIQITPLPSAEAPK